MAPEFIIIVSQTAPDLSIIGIKAAEPNIFVLVVAVGIFPLKHQFLASNQSVLTRPYQQLSGGFIVTVIACENVVAQEDDLIALTLRVAEVLMVSEIKPMVPPVPNTASPKGVVLLYN